MRSAPEVCGCGRTGKRLPSPATLSGSRARERVQQGPRLCQATAAEGGRSWESDSIGRDKMKMVTLTSLGEDKMDTKVSAKVGGSTDQTLH